MITPELNNKIVDCIEDCDKLDAATTIMIAEYDTFLGELSAESKQIMTIGKTSAILKTQPGISYTEISRIDGIIEELNNYISTKPYQLEKILDTIEKLYDIILALGDLFREGIDYMTAEKDSQQKCEAKLEELEKALAQGKESYDEINKWFQFLKTDLDNQMRIYNKLHN